MQGLINLHLRGACCPSGRIFGISCQLLKEINNKFQAPCSWMGFKMTYSFPTIFTIKSFRSFQLVNEPNLGFNILTFPSKTPCFLSFAILPLQSLFSIYRSGHLSAESSSMASHSKNQIQPPSHALGPHRLCAPPGSDLITYHTLLTLMQPYCSSSFAWTPWTPSHFRVLVFALPSWNPLPQMWGLLMVSLYCSRLSLQGTSLGRAFLTS